MPRDGSTRAYAFSFADRATIAKALQRFKPTTGWRTAFRFPSPHSQGKADRDCQRPACFEPARERGDVGNGPAAAVAEAVDKMKQIKLDGRVEEAEAGDEQRTRNGTDNDDDTRVEAIDQPAGEHPADARADEITGGRAARERHRE